MSCPAAAGRGGSASRSDPDRRFPRSSRLTSRRQFLEIYDRGRKVISDSFVLFAMPNDLGRCRLGITVTRKVGTAVRRNRIKRRVREVFRLHRSSLSPGLDLVVNARSALDATPVPELEAEFMARFEQLARRFRG